MRAVSGLVIVALILPLVPWSIRPCEAQGDYVQRVLLFTVVDNTDAGIKDLGRLATNKLQVALNDFDEIVCTEFDRTSPIVQRAISEGQYIFPYSEFVRHKTLLEDVSLLSAFSVAVVKTEEVHFPAARRGELSF